MKTKVLIVPYTVWIVLFVAVPLGLILYFGFTDHRGGFTPEHIFEAGEYSSIILKSLWLSAISTAICLVLGFPIAYTIGRVRFLKESTLLLILMLPMWMNFLLRTYSWMSLLENNGLINKLFSLAGIGHFHLINTQGAVVLGMVYNYLPFMILPLHSVMSKIGEDVIEASGDLGGNAVQTLRRIIIPLSMPGIKTGITMVFVPSVSTFLISQMLGGGSNQLVGDIIELQFLGNAYNPHLGSAISIFLMVIVLLIMGLMGFFDDEDLGGNIL